MSTNKSRGATPKTSTDIAQKPKIENNSKPAKNRTPPINSSQRSTLKIWISHHKLAFANALGRIKKSPLPTLLTILVVGVALALPATLQVITKNVEPSQQALNEQAQITLFLKSDASSVAITELIDELKNRDNISSVQHIPASQAWETFQHATGLDSASSLLDKNPLPETIIVQPSSDARSIESIKILSTELQNSPLVDLAKIDMQWIQRLHAIIDFIKYTSIAISIFLIFTVLVVIGNTIKMLGLNFRDEIIVSLLVGANDSYVRRPFLYSGIIYGFAGACCAIFFVLIGVLALTPQLDKIAVLYQSPLNITTLGLSDILSLLLIGIILGLGGAWVSANRLINSMAV